MATPLNTHDQGSAPHSDALREERLEVRLTRDQKALVVRAAATSGATLTQFVRQALQDAARRTVTEHELLQLCVQDQVALAEALLDPREPGEKLKAAYDSYRERIGV